MAYYLIADIDVHDQETYTEYQKLVPATIEQYGGKYLVRGGEFSDPPNDWDLHRVVILEFPSSERAAEWMNSPEYAPVKAIRESASTSRGFSVEGV